MLNVPRYSESPTKNAPRVYCIYGVRTIASTFRTKAY